MLDLNWTSLPLAVLDVETTGLDAKVDRVIEVGVVRFAAGEVVSRFGRLVNPERDVPPEVVKLTGIKPEDLAGAPKFHEIVAEVVENLSGAVVVAYNLSFDRGFIQAELARCGRSWPDAPELDPLVFVRQLQRTQGSKKLGAVAARMGIALENAHRAVDDAEVAGRVLYGLATQLPARLRDLVELQRQWEAVQAQEFARWRRNRGASEDGGLLSTDANAAGSADEEADGTPSLGPAYVWGDETDPIRAMFIGFPDIGARRG